MFAHESGLVACNIGWVGIVGDAIVVVVVVVVIVVVVDDDDGGVDEFVVGGDVEFVREYGGNDAGTEWKCISVYSFIDTKQEIMLHNGIKFIHHKCLHWMVPSGRELL